jgi:DHA2 family multidrug resistance protein-like MFS transporter
MDARTVRAHPTEGIPSPARRLAVAVIAIGTTMAVLDGTIANVALPTIARELRVDPAASVWVVNGFQLTVAVSLLSLASLGDVIGYRRVYTGGVVVFTVGSLLCAISHSLPELVAARVLQGLGAAAIMSVGPALYRTIFPSGQLGKALGISALVVASSATAGPTIGGAILAVLPWPWLFAINVPLGILDAVLAPRALPFQHALTRRFDVISALLSVPALGGLVVGIDGVARHAPPLGIATSFAAALAFGAAFIVRQRRIDPPLLPLDIFAVRRFSLAATTSFGSFVAQGLAYVALPFLLQVGLGYTPVVSGLLITPWPFAIAVVATPAGRLADRYPAPVLCTAGLAVFAAGLALLARLPSHATALDVMWRCAICGIGFGFFQSPNNRELLGSVPRERSGGASGVLSTVRVTGQAIGAALTALVLASAGRNGATMGAAAATALAVAALSAVLATAASATRLRSSG